MRTFKRNSIVDGENFQEPLFTIAKERFYEDASPPYLLFFDPRGIDIEDFANLCLDKNLQQAFQPPYIAFVDLKSPNVCHLTVDFKGVAPSLLETGRVTDKVVILREDRLPLVIRPLDIYNSCSAPHKYVTGCEQCVKEKHENDCLFKELIYDQYMLKAQSSIEDFISAKDLYDSWKNKKPAIGCFSYVGPGLTSHQLIAPALRFPGEHDFSYLEANKQCRKAGSIERQRHQTFKAKTCPNCFVKKGCWEHARRQSGETCIRYCDGNYAATKQEVVREILRKVNIPFTYDQLTFLLVNSGELHKRINRCKYFASLDLAYNPESGGHRTLAFTLTRCTEPGRDSKLVYYSFDEAKDILSAHKDELYTPLSSDRITKERKATLVELARRYDSPQYRAGWGTIAYPKRGITQKGSQLIMHYQWRSRGGPLPWRLRIDKLEDVFDAYGRFEYASNEKSEHRRRNH